MILNLLKGNICKKIVLWFLCITILLFQSIISTNFYDQKSLNQEIFTKISNIVTTKVNRIDPFYSRKLGLSSKLNSFNYLNGKNKNLFRTNTLIFNQNTNSNQNNDKYSSDLEWFICIPKINLKAEIKDGVSQDVLNKYVGHFDQTPRFDGNVCLAAHNRGYSVNYFAEIKDLQMKDSIFYFYNNNLYEYKVIDMNEIEETDWTKLENANVPILTLITCVEDMPNLRRYLQAELIGVANERMDILVLD